MGVFFFLCFSTPYSSNETSSSHNTPLLRNRMDQPSKQLVENAKSEEVQSTSVDSTDFGQQENGTADTSSDVGTFKNTLVNSSSEGGHDMETFDEPSMNKCDNVLPALLTASDTNQSFVVAEPDNKNAQEKHTTIKREKRSHSRERTKCDRYRPSHCNEYRHRDHYRRNSPYNKHSHHRGRSRSRGRYETSKNFYYSSKKDRSRSRERNYHYKSRRYDSYRHYNDYHTSHGYRDREYQDRRSSYEEVNYHRKSYNSYRSSWSYYPRDKEQEYFNSPKHTTYYSSSLPKLKKSL
ncbi:E3 ubiquitin-protein ligase Topors-like [Xenopus laevis]|uniref:E3 ubiquitin-protein ligase Topors-like n=1 Tax=Xenopus laevis TaxID=8355 RepID=A0A8J0U2C5_XENLA|nr:E3 ubiquitin-protein ligase Topors-like [Xenopus laevis]